MARPLIETETRPTNAFAQWFGVLGGAVAWAMQLQTNYALVPRACQVGDLKWIHLASAVFLALAVSACAVGGIDWRKSKNKSPGSREPAEARSSFMGLLGLLISSLFALVIIAQWLAVLFFHPCEQ
jgi:hypothetical protein